MLRRAWVCGLAMGVAALSACPAPTEGETTSSGSSGTGRSSSAGSQGASSGSQGSSTTASAVSGSSGTGSSGGGTSTGASSSGGVPAECLGPQPGVAPVRLLTRAEYNHTVRDVLGDTTSPANAFPPENQALGFGNNADAHRASPLLVTKLQDAAEAVASRAVAARLNTMAPCSTTLPNDGIQDANARAARVSCGQALVATMGRRLFRRPLSSDESMSLHMLLGEQVAAGRPFHDAAAMLLEVMLQSPAFLYRVAEVQPGEADGQVLPLTDYEVASRLSYFLWASAPDDTLLDAAGRGDLRSVTRLRAEAERMLNDPRAKGALRDFHGQWLKLDKLDALERDVPSGADLNTLRASWKESIQRFMEYAVLESPDSLEALFGGSRTYVDAALGSLYGQTVGAGVVPVDLPAAERGAGLLSQPALLALLSHPAQSSPVIRGIFVREQLMCEHLDPPPPGLVITPPSPDPNATTRERFAQHTTDENCFGCHVRMDPVGFGFEHFDALGRYRANEGGLAINDDGELLAVDEDFALEGPFDGVTGLAAKLKQSRQVTTCLTRQWFRYAFGRGDSASPQDACTVTLAHRAFEGASHDVRGMLVTLATSDAMRLRPGRTQGPVPPVVEPDAGVPLPDAGGAVPDAGQPGDPVGAPPMGFLDSVSAAGLVSGWALDRNVPSYALTLETWMDGPPGQGEFIYPVYRADLPRPDVNQATGWQGDHGFRFVLPARFHDGLQHRLWVVAQDAGNDGSTVLSGSPVTFTIGGSNRLPRGYVDVVGATVAGWAYDPDSSPTPIRVQFWLDGPPWGTGTLLGETMTGGDRPDVNVAFGLDAATRSGWGFSVPASARDGRQHLLYVVAQDATQPGDIFTLLNDTAHALQVNP
jgi:hypothetical protein